MTAADGLGEFELIARVFAPLAADGALGLTDDAAFYRPRPGLDLVLTKDEVVSGVHFFADDAWDAVARKALRVNLSDLAAKGAAPVGYLLALGLPKDFTGEQIDALGAGLAADQATYGISLYGGDTVRSPAGLTLSVTAIGEVRQGGMVRRGGAQVEEIIVVTGTIGDAALGLSLRLDPALSDRLGLSAEHRGHLLDRYLLPQPRGALASAVADCASGGMDISDGLVGDLGKMAAASGVAIEIDADRVPLSTAAKAAVSADPRLLAVALTGGDDYELALSIPRDKLDTFLAAAAAQGVGATAIGRVRSGEGVAVRGDHPALTELGSGSYRHF
ncbi:thiamine-phosphate kinase [Pleomorphomonas sp. JP5]|uniref:thiamine-phosphate kinase n=1 Tax=Pleomorphomonas sp. JP5 TaxID=2942998 RepID=UPI0020436365|nr:thiamine-phosphate kinase [Pleomorphomonas sp. JP5]MCM5559937.1 thiamine-phosphate kinase [Pleomorphomonas sp. JP5]